MAAWPGGPVGILFIHTVVIYRIRQNHTISFNTYTFILLYFYIHIALQWSYTLLRIRPYNLSYRLWHFAIFIVHSNMDPCNAIDWFCFVQIQLKAMRVQLFPIQCVDFFCINRRWAAECTRCAMKTLLSSFSHFSASAACPLVKCCYTNPFSCL